jgi:two-component system, cell cycle sensor histidine kinase and response regulator CckA
VIMPRMGGAELAKTLQARRPGLKVLFVSGYTDEALSERGALQHGLELLRKPASPTELLQRVRTVLDRSQG